jgi:hypothetical protein
MALRRRQRRTEQSKIDATPPWETRHRDEPEPTSGPYDERDAPDDEVARVNLGALQVPVRPGIEMRLDMNDAQQVIAVTLVNRDGQMQLGVFAAPRNEGIWDDVRTEIRDSIASQRGSCREREGGPFGTELVGTLKPEGGGTSPVRFLGVDGPRWFIRAMMLGAAAAEPAKGRVFEETFRNTVVVRGREPLPVRDPVPLQLPKEAAAQLEQSQQDTSGEGVE